MEWSGIDLQHVARAIALAEEHSADGRDGPFGAVVARGAEPLAEGWNRVVSAADPTAHAEICAIREACRALESHDLSGCTIYCSCEPCPMCLSAIYWARIGRVVYACSRQDAARAGFDDARIYEELAVGWERRAVAGAQLERERGRAVLNTWARNPNRCSY
jgi:guanine deaminase